MMETSIFFIIHSTHNFHLNWSFNVAMVTLLFITNSASVCGIATHRVELVTRLEKYVHGQ